MRECASWRTAFDLQAHEHIALVGGGGKTTTLWSLARELSREGRSVATATTKAGAPPSDAALVLWRDGMSNATLQVRLTEAWGRAALVALGNQVRPDRLQAVAPEALDFIFSNLNAQVVNEADGARMRPFKAPAGHEPVLANSTTLALIIIGAESIGAPIDAEHVHRPELVSQITGAAAGERLRPEHVSAVVGHYIERVQEQAPHARAAVLLNKVDAGPGRSEHELVQHLRAIPLAAVVAATQRDETRRWRLG
jgi:probable selenium-dependent hydroxylase accessory protein YqeC